MAQGIAEFLLSVDGCPYAFGTQGLSALPTTSSSYTSDFSSAWTLLRGALKQPSVSFTEAIEPIDGDLIVDGLDFTLFDIDRTITTLCSRLVTSVTQALLATSIDSDDTSIVLDNASSFPSGSQVVWIGREAILCSGKSSNTLTVTTRGYYGSHATRHEIDADNIYYPVVYSEMPFFTRRKVILWLVVSGSAVPLWRGFIQRAPKLNSDGISWDIQCDPVWSVTKGSTVATPTATTKLRGFDAKAVSISLSAPAGTSSAWVTKGISGEDFPVYRTFSDCLKAVEEEIKTFVVDAGHGDKYRVTVTQADGGVVLSATATSAGAITAGLIVGSEQGTNSSQQTSDPRAVEVYLPVNPQVVVALTPFASENKLPLTTVKGLPSTFSDESETTSGIATTRVRQVLTTALEDSRNLVFYAATSSEDDTDLVAGGPAASGYWTVVDSATGRVDFTGSGFGAYSRFDTLGEFLLIESPLTVRLAAEVDTTHFVHGLRYSLFDPEFTALNSTLDTRDWSWENADNIISSTVGVGTSRRWLLDGTQTIESLISDAFRANGVALGMKSSKITPFALAPPLPTSTNVTTLSQADIIGISQWADYTEGLVNRIDITTPFGRVIVQDQQSRAQYGETRTIEVDVTSTNDTALDTSDPTALGLGFLRKLTGLWRHPPKRVSIKVSAVQNVTRLWLGDYVSFTSWHLPDSAGGRGGTLTGQIISRTLDIEEGTISIDLLVYQVGNPAGYAPCCRVESRSGAVLTIATGYLSGVATDYAGSNLSGYTVANDGGTGYFSSGMKVRLITRDSTTLTQETGLVVSSVNPAAKTITLTTTPSTSISSASDYVDLIFDDYSASTPTAAQVLYGWVSDGTPPVIDGTSEKAKTFL